LVGADGTVGFRRGLPGLALFLDPSLDRRLRSLLVPRSPPRRADPERRHRPDPPPAARDRLEAPYRLRDPPRLDILLRQGQLLLLGGAAAGPAQHRGNASRLGLLALSLIGPREAYDRAGDRGGEGRHQTQLARRHRSRSA